MNEKMIGDFDFSITDIELAHKFHYVASRTYDIYTSGRNISGIVYCLQGEAEYIFQDTSVVLKKDEMIFLSEDFAYTVNAKSEFYHITVNFNLNHGDCYRLRKNGYLKTPPHVIPSGSLNAGERLQQILEIWEEKKMGFHVKIKALLYDLLYEYFISVKREHQPAEYIKVRPAKQILDTRFSENIPISELASACGFTESYFRHLFTKVFQCSPGEYRLKKRLLKAKDLLLAGELSVNEIAATVGFEDANYFSRLFKSHEHISPSAYGRSNK